MYNNALKKDVNEIKRLNHDLLITFGTIGGVSLEITNTKTSEDFGSYIYSKKPQEVAEKERDADFNELEELLK